MKRYNNFEHRIKIIIPIIHFLLFIIGYYYLYHFNRSMTLKFVEYSFCLLYILSLYLFQYQWKSELETRVSSMTLSIRLLNPKANATTSYYSFEQADKQYGENNSYVERLNYLAYWKIWATRNNAFIDSFPLKAIQSILHPVYLQLRP